MRGGLVRRVLAGALACAAVLGLATPSAGAPIDDTGPVRIAFIGDSITGSPGCWRAPVWAGLTDAGYRVEMVGLRTADECGGVTNAAGELWDPDNTGIGGISTTGMWVRLAKDDVLAQLKPDVVVQLLGTNDFVGRASQADVLAQYDMLLELYREHNPGVSVVVGAVPQIAPNQCDCQAEIAALDAGLEEWARHASTATSPVTVARIDEGFDPATDTDDGIHPNASGVTKLAAAWEPAIAAALDARALGAVAEPSPAGGVTGEVSTSLSPWTWLWLALAVAAAGAVALGGAARRRRGDTPQP